MSAETPAPCIGNDPSCPCVDGDLCHYKGDDAWPIPAPSAAEVEALAEVLLVEWLAAADDKRVQSPDDHCRDLARRGIAAGYVSPARHAAEVQAARAEALREALEAQAEHLTQAEDTVLDQIIENAAKNGRKGQRLLGKLQGILEARSYALNDLDKLA